MHKFSYIVILFLLAACGSEKIPEDLDSHIDQFIANDQYEKALDILAEIDSRERKEELVNLREKVHLNYGLYLEYRGPEDSSMRERMISALLQYIEVLKINPENAKAQTEIRQIMGVYSTMPGRSPGNEIVDELNKLGFDY